MNKHEPKPLIEEHYHIQSLIEGQEKRANDRQYHKDRIKSLQERDELISDSKLVCVTDFWCHKCKQDFKSMTIREVETDWTNTAQRIAFYRGKCDKGHWCIRFITDRHKDGFWVRSQLMAIDRGKHFADIIQPYQTNFNLLYGKKGI